LRDQTSLVKAAINAAHTDFQLPRNGAMRLASLKQLNDLIRLGERYLPSDLDLWTPSRCAEAPLMALQKMPIGAALGWRPARRFTQIVPALDGLR
jgi:hypothetical protein